MKSTKDFKKKSRRFNDQRRAALAIETYDDIIRKIIKLEVKTNELLNDIVIKPVSDH